MLLSRENIPGAEMGQREGVKTRGSGVFEEQPIGHLYTFFSEKEMVTYSSTLAWRVPWTEEPGGLQSMGSLRVGHD